MNIDNVQAVREAAAHLLLRGYRRIGVIVGPQDTMTGRDRLQGYRAALTDAAPTPDPALQYTGKHDEQSGYEGTLRLLEVAPSVDALFPTSNVLTRGALRALHECKTRVPGEVALVSFDHALWEIPGVPMLTCVVQPALALGSTVTQVLIEFFGRAP